jgi:hypothetical protein
MAVPEEQVYVCLNCGRCSCDQAGRRALSAGWGRSCCKAAVRFSIEDLCISPQGIVQYVRKGAVTAVQQRGLSALN